jgi:hypothetical protein
MHRCRLARELLHFLLFVAEAASSHPMPVLQRFSELLHFLHFALGLSRGLHPLQDDASITPVRLNAAGRDHRLPGRSGLAHGRMNDA